jgi:uncharacterized protein YndB with AHSA1/START domain
MTIPTQDQDFQTTLDLITSPDTVYEALTTTNGVSSWWAPATGSASTGGELEWHFRHAGLVPQLGCYEQCSNDWGHFLHSSLVSYLETGIGHPVGS